MAILDANLEFAAAMDVKAAGAVLFTDKIDLSAARNLGNIPIVVGWTIKSFTAGAGTNIYFEVLTDGDAAMGSPKVIAASPTYVTADLGVGVHGTIPLPAVSPNHPFERYLGLRKQGAGAFTALTVQAGIIINQQSNVMAG